MNHWVPQTLPIPESLILHPHKTSPSPLSLYCSIDENCDITGTQLVMFRLSHLGTYFESLVIRTDEKGDRFCFLKCETKKIVKTAKITVLLLLSLKRV